MSGRRSRVLLAAAIVAAVTAIVVLAAYGLSHGPSAPTRLADWYVGSWRVDGPMVGIVRGRLVDRPKASPGQVVIAAPPAGGLTVVMKGFPGVLPGASTAKLDQLKLNFATRGSDGQTTAWAFVLGSDGKAAVAAFDPTTGRYTANVPLARE